MPDLTPSLWSQVTSAKIPGLDLGAGLAFPSYAGLSVLNLPSSLCRWLGGPELPHPPLDLPALNQMASGISQVIFVLLDAVSHQRFQRWLNNAGPEAGKWVEEGLLAPISSLVPSTTSTALTTLWTGASPAEHAVIGYELFLKRYGLVANMITHSPVAFEGVTGELQKAGFDPSAALPVPTLGPLLVASGIEVRVLMPSTIAGSGLSRMLYNGAGVHSYRTLEDLWRGVKEIQEQPRADRRLLWVYYGNLDTASHRFGPDSDQAQQELHLFLNTMLQAIRGLRGTKACDDTLVVLASDHGQISTPQNPAYDLRNHPLLLEMLHMHPTGENRLPYLYLRPGQTKNLVSYFAKVWHGAFELISSSVALQRGLFGPGKPAADTRDRLGDVLAISHGDAYLWWGSRDNPLLGRHGGLSVEEMIIPLLVTRLG